MEKIVVLISIFLLTLIRGQVYSQAASDYYPGDTWRTSSPEAQGMNSEYLTRMLNSIKSSEIHSVIIIRHGYVVLEAYSEPFGRDELHILKSCSKSVTSALIGIAIREGYIKSVDQKVVDILSNQYAINNLDDKKQAVTIEHLLTMTSGIKQQEINSKFPDKYLRSWNLNQYYLDEPMEAEPGQVFHYDSAGVNLLMAILRETSGMYNSDFADKFLFKPIGITNYYWQKDRQGNYTGGWGLAMTSMDMARFGYLYLKKGRWEGSQVIPAEWVSASMSNHFTPPYSVFPSYGYLWWKLPFGGFTAVGYGGQYIMVMPERDMVAVFTSGFSPKNAGYPLKPTADYINKSIVSDTAIPEDEMKQASLTSAILNFGNPAENNPEVIRPEIENEISGKSYIFQSNPWHLGWITLTFSREGECTFEESGARDWFFDWSFKIPVGLDGKYREDSFNSYTDLYQKHMARGKWINNNTLVIEFYEPWSSGSKIQYTMEFNENNLKMTVNFTTGEAQQQFTGKSY